MSENPKIVCTCCGKPIRLQDIPVCAACKILIEENSLGDKGRASDCSLKISSSISV